MRVTFASIAFAGLFAALSAGVTEARGQTSADYEVNMSLDAPVTGRSRDGRVEFESTGIPNCRSARFVLEVEADDPGFFERERSDLRALAQAVTTEFITACRLAQRPISIRRFGLTLVERDKQGTRLVRAGWDGQVLSLSRLEGHPEVIAAARRIEGIRSRYPFLDERGIGILEDVLGMSIEELVDDSNLIGAPKLKATFEAVQLVDYLQRSCTLLWGSYGDAFKSHQVVLRYLVQIDASANPARYPEFATARKRGTAGAWRRGLEAWQRDMASTARSFSETTNCEGADVLNARQFYRQLATTERESLEDWIEDVSLGPVSWAVQTE